MLYAASLAAKMYNTLAKLTFVLVETNIWGYKKLQGRLKPIRAKKPVRKSKKIGDLFLLFFGDSKIFVAPPPAKNPDHAFGFIHIYLGGGGGGGGGFSPDFCENTILRYELAMMARTCTNDLRVVLSP